jgi:hypothetical protein
MFDLMFKEMPNFFTSEEDLGVFIVMEDPAHDGGLMLHRHPGGVDFTAHD